MCVFNYWTIVLDEFWKHYMDWHKKECLFALKAVVCFFNFPLPFQKFQLKQVFVVYI